ncbi:hypothetical protein ID866_6027 [Astraeus odoratus]|nr:hypothetical protein ID866_6027 [Astraeus odoratus]
MEIRAKCIQTQVAQAVNGGLVNEQIHLTDCSNREQRHRPLDKKALRQRMWDELLYEYEAEAQKWMKHEAEERRRSREREREEAKRRSIQEDISRIQTRVRERRDSERQTIADERRRQAERAKEMQRREQERLQRTMSEAWKSYESRWMALSSSSETLHFQDIPWPVLTAPESAADITTDSIATFILNPAHSSNQSRRERIRSALLRWHPDRFRRLLQRVPESEQSAVEEGICAVTRCLNDLLVSKKSTLVNLSYSTQRDYRVAGMQETNVDSAQLFRHHASRFVNDPPTLHPPKRAISTFQPSPDIGTSEFRATSMDVLVHHCIRELSFDGGLGCNVSRLRDFITAFYNGYDGPQQVVDDALCAFVWSVIVLRPEVCVGVIPPGITSEVYIAPQTSAKRKAAAKGEQLFEDGPPVLQVIEDARTKTLQELKSQYGEDLRIAVDPQTSFAAITGSHIRPAKLSPMVYSALQLITRGREEGITTVELGRKTKYDQKTCFYVIKQLIELGLVIKVRRAGVANYTCIHKYFVERSPLWQQIQQEEANDSDIAVTGPHVQMSDPVDKATVPNETPEITFDPIDGKHLSSLQLVKNRIVRLLKASINHMHALNNLLVAIGFNNPTKTDRRFFRTRLRELIQQGTIERVSVPHSTVGGRMVKCIRLVEPHSQLPKGGRVIDAHDVDEDEKDALYDVSGGYTDVKSNMTIHKQVSNLLEEAGPSGLTLQEICSALGNFDKRTIELLLTRAAKNPLPSHLRDLATIDVMETHGRERRHRYFTLAAYKMAMTAENLQGADAAHGEVDLSRVGEFAEFDAKVFYTNSANLFDHLQPAKVKISVDKKRKRSMERASGDEIDGPPLTRRGRPRKHPVADDSQPPRKRGRPRKYPLSVEGGEDRTPKKRGRPPKKRNHDTATTSDGLQGVLSPSGAGTVPLQDAAPSDMRMQEPGRSEDVTEEIGKPGFVNDRPSREVGDTDLVAERPHIPVTEAQPTSCGHDGELLAEGVSQTHPATGSRLVEGTLHDASLNEGDAAINTELPAAGSSAPYTLELLPSKDGGQTSGKRSLSLNSLTSGSTKRPKTAGLGDKARSSINISALRRENELFRVIEELGGITNLHTKEIYEAHTALLDTMNKEGEPTSAPPGTRLDKRTAEATLKSLENRGRIKMLKTSIMSGSGASKPACLLYLPDTPQESINEYLRRLSQNMPLASTPSPVKTVGHVEFGVGRRVSQRLPCPGGASEKEPQISDVDPAEQIPIHDSQTLESVPPCERRRKRSKRKKSAQANIEARAALRKKAEEAKHQREQDWVQLLDRVHPEPVKGTLAMHIRILRARFMQSTSIKDLNLWEEEIRKTIRDTELAAKKILSRPKRLQTSYRKPTGPPPMVANPPEKSVASLVAQQGSHVAQHTKSKSKGKEKDKEDSDGKLWQRRSRFQWTREFDELARDASAIIRARCRDIGRLDLSAFDQVFPSVPRNSVRQRIVHLRESAGEDLYMKRLEDQWYTMWVQHRGTIHLPDDDPESPSNFDLVKHLEFLRKHVDKNAL